MKKINYKPPSATDLEEAILGALMIDSKATDEVMIIIKNPEVFYEPKHQEIYKAIRSLYDENEAIDILTVSTRLKAMEKLDAVGGDYYLIQITKKVASSAHIETHCRLLLQFWIRRQCIRDASVLTAKAYDPTEDVFDILNDAGLSLDTIHEQVSGRIKEGAMEESLVVVRDRVETLSNKSETEITGLPTGFKKVDRFTGGFQPTDLIIIAGRPGMGKTALALNTLLACAKANIPCGVVSLEMSTVQLVTRLVACNSHFHLNQLFRYGFDKQEYFTQFLELQDEMKHYPMYFDEHSTDIRDIYAKARLWKRKHDIQLLVVDYIQLASDRTKSYREQEISSISRNLKKLAKELNIPVIAVSQLSREVESRPNKRPMLRDLRESGAIEQDADMVIFIYRPEYYGFLLDEQLLACGANTELIFAKYRNGSLDRKGLYFDANKTKFIDPQASGGKEAIAAAEKAKETDDDLPF